MKSERVQQLKDYLGWQKNNYRKKFIYSSFISNIKVIDWLFSLLSIPVFFVWVISLFISFTFIYFLVWAIIFFLIGLVLIWFDEKISNLRKKEDVFYKSLIYIELIEQSSEVVDIELLEQITLFFEHKELKESVYFSFIESSYLDSDKYTFLKKYWKEKIKIFFEISTYLKANNIRNKSDISGKFIDLEDILDKKFNKIWWLNSSKLDKVSVDNGLYTWLFWKRMEKKI